MPEVSEAGIISSVFFLSLFLFFFYLYNCFFRKTTTYYSGNEPEVRFPPGRRKEERKKNGMSHPRHKALWLRTNFSSTEISNCLVKYFDTRQLSFTPSASSFFSDRVIVYVTSCTSSWLVSQKPQIVSLATSDSFLFFPKEIKVFKGHVTLKALGYT